MDTPRYQLDEKARDDAPLSERLVASEENPWAVEMTPLGRWLARRGQFFRGAVMALCVPVYVVWGLIDGFRLGMDAWRRDRDRIFEIAEYAAGLRRMSEDLKARGWGSDNAGEVQRMDRDEVQRRMELLQVPIDFDELVADEILAREGAWYRILDPDRVPDHVWVQIGSARKGEDGQLMFRFPGRSG